MSDVHDNVLKGKGQADKDEEQRLFISSGHGSQSSPDDSLPDDEISLTKPSIVTDELYNTLQKMVDSAVKELKDKQDTITVRLKAEIEQLKFDQGMAMGALKAECKAQVEILKDLVSDKDKEINLLNRKIGELECSVQTTDNRLESTISTVAQTGKDVDRVVDDMNCMEDKAAELEDRSMRQNLIFFGFPEADNETNEDCEKKLSQLIQSKKLLGPNSHVQFDRVHRLGRKNVAGSQGKPTRPRPIVCKLTFYKDKDILLQNGKLLKGSAIRMSEQYSKRTTEIHSKIFQSCKRAKESPGSTIDKFFVKYKHAVVYLKSGKRITVNANTVKDSNWFKNFQ